MKKRTSNILKLMNQSIDVVKDEVLPGKAVNVIALAINHVKEGDSEDCYTQEELVSALREQVSALQDYAVDRLYFDHANVMLIKHCKM